MSSRARWWLAAAFIILAAVRILIAWQLPITDDEAYYWTWSQSPQWGYPDHPPLIAGIIKLTTSLFGDGRLGIRLGPLLFTLATGVVVYVLGRDMFGVPAGIVAALTSQLLPLVAAGGALAVPDAPFVFFWMLTLWLVWRARTTAGGRGTYWVAAGAALGLALMSKLFAGFLALGLAGFLLTSPADRQWLRTPHPYAAAVLALTMTAPFIWWNATEGWPSWVKVSHQIPWIRQGSPAYKAIVYAAAQFVYYGPLTAPALAVALRVCARLPQGRDRRFAFLAWTALPIFLVPFILSPGGIPKPHWPAPAYLVAAVAAAGLWWSTARPRRGLLVSALAVNGGVLALLMLQPWIAPSALAQTRGWNQVTAQVDALAQGLPSRPGVFIFSTGYQTASQLAYRLRGRYLVTTASTDTAFAHRLPLERFVHWNGIYVDDDREPIGIPIRSMFTHVRRLTSITVTVDGREIRRFVVYRGLDFRDPSTN